MSDFYITTGFLRSEISDALADNEEQAMWVLADLAERVDVLNLVENIQVIDGDAESVAAFFDDLAERQGSRGLFAVLHADGRGWHGAIPALAGPAD